MNNTALQISERLNTNESLQKTELYEIYIKVKTSSTEGQYLSLLKLIGDRMYNADFLNETKEKLNSTRNAIHDFLGQLSEELVEHIRESLRTGFIIKEEDNNKTYFYSNTDDEDIAQLQLNKIDNRYSISGKQFIEEWVKMYRYELQ